MSRSKKNILEDFESYGAESLTWLDSTAVAKLFLASLRETEFGQKIDQKGLWTSDNMDMIVERTVSLAGPEFSFGQFVKVADMLVRLGKLVAPEVEPEPEIERDRLGRPITEAQRRWQEMADWSNAPTTTMKMVEERRRTDPKFAKFFAEQNALRRNENPTDAVQAAGGPTEYADANQQLRNFAYYYVREPIENLKPKGGYVRLAGEAVPYQTFLRLVTDATNAGLLK